MSTKQSSEILPKHEPDRSRRRHRRFHRTGDFESDHSELEDGIYIDFVLMVDPRLKSSLMRLKNFGWTSARTGTEESLEPEKNDDDDDRHHHYSGISRDPQLVLHKTIRLPLPASGAKTLKSFSLSLNPLFVSEWDRIRFSGSILGGKKEKKIKRNYVDVTLIPRGDDKDEFDVKMEPKNPDVDQHPCLELGEDWRDYVQVYVDNPGGDLKRLDASGASASGGGDSAFQWHEASLSYDREDSYKKKDILVKFPRYFFSPTLKWEIQNLDIPEVPE